MRDPIFDPIVINQLNIKNRIYMPAMHMGMAVDFEVTDPLINFYAERARGGAGLICVGYATVDDLSGNTTNIGAHRDEFIPGLNRLAKARERKRAENGKCEGAKGWNEIEPERKEEILKIIKKMRRKPRNQGRPSTYQAIADHLNAAGLQPLKGGEWSASLVHSFHRKAVAKP